VPCAPIHDVPAALADAPTRHRGMVVEIGEHKGVTSPIKLSRTPVTCRVEPPTRGGEWSGAEGLCGPPAAAIGFRRPSGHF
jgi:crotonobetainyl-CoA:carnitine CoA-transferase CaiB-like acyl-CoA transferase